MKNGITCADLDWHINDNELAKSRHVFIESNQLPKRFDQCIEAQTHFTIAELGFGTGLNFLATWQLWQQSLAKRTASNHAHLHYIGFEKHPFNKADLHTALASWKTTEPQLTDVIDQLLNHYPTLIEGCHRVRFYNDHLTLDLWFGRVQDNLDKLHPLTSIDTWFFNEFDHNHDRPTTSLAIPMPLKETSPLPPLLPSMTQQNIAVIGAGISGLMTAWSLASRGMRVTLIDKAAPLAGASGNPRVLLAPKMTPIHHVDEHLHSIGYLYSSRLFRQLSEGMATPILETTGILDLLIKSNISTDQIREYPTDFAQVLDDEVAKRLTGLKQQDLSSNQFLPQGGLINPQILATRILQHPLIHFQIENITDISEQGDNVTLTTADNNALEYDHAVICLAYQSHQLDNRIFDFRKIRGQLSWFSPTKEQADQLPKLPLKYGGYCAQFIDSEQQTQFLLGASFVRNDMDLSAKEAEHQQNREKLITAMPALASSMPTDTTDWQARTGIRSQTPDYHPLVGRLADSDRLWTMSGMGAKGYAFAPICAETLADQMTHQIPALSQNMVKKLDPNRDRLQDPLTK